MRNPVEPGRRPNSIGSVAQLYNDVSRSAFRHGEDVLFDHIVHEWVDLMAIARTLRRGVVDRAAAVSGVDEVTSDLAEEWRAEARSLGEDADTLRALVDDFQAGLVELTGPRDQSDATILFLCARWMEETESLAELMENLAETLALAAHEPFQELVKAEIKTVRSV